MFDFSILLRKVHNFSKCALFERWDFWKYNLFRPFDFSEALTQSSVFFLQLLAFWQCNIFNFFDFANSSLLFQEYIMLLFATFLTFRILLHFSIAKNCICNFSIVLLLFSVPSCALTLTNTALQKKTPNLLAQ